MSSSSIVVVGKLELRQVAEVGIAATGFGLAALGIAKPGTRLQSGSQ